MRHRSLRHFFHSLFCLALQRDAMTPNEHVWDCHTHIFGPWDSYPLPPDAVYRPAEATFDTLRALHARMGITRGVIVQGACYGPDHTALLGALAASGGAYRGIAVIDPDIPEATLRAMHDGGVRGIRLGAMAHLGGGGSAIDTGRMRDSVARIAPYGWHVLVHAQPDDTLAILQALEGCGVPQVIDHMARLAAEGGLQSRAGAALLHRLEAPEIWIKVSGADRVTEGRPEDALAQVRQLVQAAPERALWGTDWPHVNIRYAAPDDAALLALVRQACGDDATAKAVLTHNPARLYG
jgi:predicted TIM-barrel fold metal-dependent hydrolase